MSERRATTSSTCPHACICTRACMQVRLCTTTSSTCSPCNEQARNPDPTLTLTLTRTLIHTLIHALLLTTVWWTKRMSKVWKPPCLPKTVAPGGIPSSRRRLGPEASAGRTMCGTTGTRPGTHAEFFAYACPCGCVASKTACTRLRTRGSRDTTPSRRPAFCMYRCVTPSALRMASSWSRSGGQRGSRCTLDALNRRSSAATDVRKRRSPAPLGGAATMSRGRIRPSSSSEKCAYSCMDVAQPRVPAPRKPSRGAAMCE